MKKQFLFASATVCFAALSFGAGISRALNLQSPALYAHEGHDHSEPDSHASSQMHSEGEHLHGMVEIPDSQPVLTVNLVAHPDAEQGWNLEVQVSNFKFAPEQVNLASTSLAEGHAYLYIDDVRITRLYGS